MRWSCKLRLSSGHVSRPDWSPILPSQQQPSVSVVKIVWNSCNLIWWWWWGVIMWWSGLLRSALCRDQQGLNNTAVNWSAFNRWLQSGTSSWDFSSKIAEDGPRMPFLIIWREGGQAHMWSTWGRSGLRWACRDGHIVAVRYQTPLTTTSFKLTMSKLSASPCLLWSHFPRELGWSMWTSLKIARY